MKILVLMPLDERSVYMEWGIWKNLPHEIRDNSFCMAGFMDHLVQVKLAASYVYAFMDAVLTATKIYNAAGDEDLIIFGNMDKSYKFDAIFNFQDIEFDAPYKDVFKDKMVQLVAEDEKLSKMINNMYTNEDSKMALHNCVATADFLTAYLKTDPGLDKLKADYEKRLKELKDKQNGKLN